MKIVIILLAIIMVVMIGLAYLEGLYSPGHKNHDWSQMEVKLKSQIPQARHEALICYGK